VEDVLRRSAQRTLAADITHWQLADGTEISILNILDDHSLLCVVSDARRNTTGADVVDSFRTAFARWGIPTSVLTDIQAWWCPEGPRIVRPAV
jgi:hypothetical protein